MAKITIDELYRGKKYDIMSSVTAKALQLGIDDQTEKSCRYSSAAPVSASDISP